MKTVLIVDDNEDTVETISDVLECHKIQIVGKAYNGKIALEKLDEVNPEVVLLDMTMPDYDGFYFLENIVNKDHKYKIIIITGDLTESTQNKLKEMNIKEIILKPIDTNKLIELINQ